MGTTHSTANMYEGMPGMDAHHEATYRIIAAILLTVPFVATSMSTLAIRFKERRHERAMMVAVNTNNNSSTGNSNPSTTSTARTSPTVAVRGHAETPSLHTPSLHPIHEDRPNSSDQPPVLVQLVDDHSSGGGSPESSVGSSICKHTSGGGHKKKQMIPTGAAAGIGLESSGNVNPGAVDTPGTNVADLSPPKNISINVEKGQRQAETHAPGSSSARVTVGLTTAPIKPASTANAKGTKGDNTTSFTPNESNVVLYLEQCTRNLHARADKAGHKDKVCMAKAIYDLGMIVYNRGLHDKAYKMFKRAASVQKWALKDTIYGLAWSLRERGLKHGRRGEKDLAQMYLDLATKLADHPNPQSVDEVWDKHNSSVPTNKKNGELINGDGRTKNGKDRLEKRLKRARAECIPLALSRKRQSECKDRMTDNANRTNNVVVAGTHQQ